MRAVDCPRASTCFPSNPSTWSALNILAHSFWPQQQPCAYHFTNLQHTEAVFAVVKVTTPNHHCAVMPAGQRQKRSSTVTSKTPPSAVARPTLAQTAAHSQHNTQQASLSRAHQHTMPWFDLGKKTASHLQTSAAHACPLQHTLTSAALTAGTAQTQMPTGSTAGRSCTTCCMRCRTVQLSSFAPATCVYGGCGLRSSCLRVDECPQRGYHWH